MEISRWVLSRFKPPDAASAARVDAYEARTAGIMTVLAVMYLIVYSTPIIWTHEPHDLRRYLAMLNVALWIAFVADVVIRALMSRRPMGFVIRHPIDLLLVALPMLRPLRILRVFTALQVLMRQGGRIDLGRTLLGTATATALLMFVAAVTVLDAERHHPGANIKSFGTALWWSGETVTTVGYGDHFPVTVTGRVVAFAMMLVGISMIGVVTASIAAWFVGRSDDPNTQLVGEIKALRAEIAELKGAPPPADQASDPAAQGAET